MPAFWLYIVECGDGSLYVGHTDDLEKRWAQHVSGAFPACHTFRRHPLRLVYACAFASRVEALERERQVKGWTRAKKWALVRGDWEGLRRVAHARPSTSAPA